MDSVEGMNPDPEKHNTYFKIQPVSICDSSFHAHTHTHTRTHPNMTSCLIKKTKAVTSFWRTEKKSSPDIGIPVFSHY